MTRWKPGGRERLQQAAVDLFRERGYEAVTVAEIAERAELTKRSFFNHFADKREVLFAGAAEFEADAVRCLRAGDPALAPFDAAVDALGRSGQTLAELAPYIAIRRDLIDSSVELRERDLIKMASLSAAIAGELAHRGVPARAARFASDAAVAAFGAAYDDWGHDPERGFAELMNVVAAELRSSLLPPL